MESPFALPSPPTSNLSGQRLGRYRIVRPLSKGGMALVFEGRRESLAGVSPRVAIKLILPEHASSETFKELFINEAKLGASMQHQNLVQIQDFDCDSDRYFLVMEYVEGLTLRKIIGLAERAKMKIPLSVVAEIGRQACDGLHYAHNARDEKGRPLHLVHRDIKPSNLILNPQGIVKVLDFGISKGRLREERKGSVKGTWGYMAPEQSIGADVGPTADVFGLAVVLYELASLRAMFQDQSKDEMRRLLKDDHAARMAATLEGHDYGPLIGVLVRALQRDPSARFESAMAFGKALSELQPDPVTARDEITRFYERIDALDRGSRPPRGQARVSGGTSTAPKTPIDDRIGISAVATFLAGAMLALGLLSVLAVLWLLTAGVERTAPPEVALAEVQPEQPAGRPPPAEISRAAPASIAQPRKPYSAEEPGGPSAASPRPTAKPSAPAPAQASLAPEIGVVTVRSVQPAEIYIGGQYVAATPSDQQLPQGTHVITIVAKDGRMRAFEVEVLAGQSITKTWDFDRMEWR